MEVQAHILPAAILIECYMPQEMTDSLNDYLDDLLKRKDRISHAATLVGQISQGEFQLPAGQKYQKKFLRAILEKHIAYIMHQEIQTVV